MTNPAPFFAVICSICGKRVNVKTDKTDQDGQSVHEGCYVENMRRAQQAVKDLFKAPVQVYPSK